MSYKTNRQQNGRTHYRTQGSTNALNNVMSSSQGTQLRTHFYKYVANKSN